MTRKCAECEEPAESGLMCCKAHIPADIAADIAATRKELQEERQVRCRRCGVYVLPSVSVLHDCVPLGPEVVN